MEPRAWLLQRCAASATDSGRGAAGGLAAVSGLAAELPATRFPEAAAVALPVC